MSGCDPFGVPELPSGRPSLFNTERAARVLVAVRRGLTYKNAASYAGISYATLNRWRIEGRERDDESEICQFWKALQQANGEAAFRLIGCIDSAAEAGDWKAATWILERRFPDDWGKRVGSEIDPEETHFPDY